MGCSTSKDQVFRLRALASDLLPLSKSPNSYMRKLMKSPPKMCNYQVYDFKSHYSTWVTREWQTSKLPLSSHLRLYNVPLDAMVILSGRQMEWLRRALLELHKNPYAFMPL